MKILAIDTSGEACSAALLLGKEVRQRLECQPRRHGELILRMMDGLLAEAGIGLAGLDALAFGRGPGSFTGVRIATSVVQGVAFGADLPVVPVSTLAALAQGHFRCSSEARALAALDARMGEVYWGAYELGAEGIMRPAGAEEVGAPDLVTLPEGDGWSGIGSGWGPYGDTLACRLGSRLRAAYANILCQSRDVATLAASAFAAGSWVTAEHALPLYLRERVTAQG